MIPPFPYTKKLALDDKKSIEAFTNTHPPISDYNFVSLWGYDTRNLVEISLLNENLVVLFMDYITNVPFYSFLGENKISDTAITLINISLQKNITPCLKLIPAFRSANYNELHQYLTIEEDRDNFDYILSVPDIALPSNMHYGKRKQLNIFERNYPDSCVRVLDLEKQESIEGILQICDDWAISRNKSQTDVENEFVAIRRTLQCAKFLCVLAIGIYIQDKLIGFAIADVSHSSVAEFHFAKGNHEYKGLYAALYIYLARELEKAEYKAMNIEQDLGISGLREAKMQWHPMCLLKKYILRLR